MFFKTTLPVDALYLFLTTLLLTYAGLKYPRYFYYFFFINFVIVLANGMHVILLDHQHDIPFVGGAVFLFAILELCLMPGFLKRTIRSLSIQSVKHLDLVQKAIFECLTQADYADSVYLYERRLHIRKKTYFRRIHRLRSLLASSENKMLANKIGTLFEILMDCAALRRRVSDLTIFALCQDELTAISNEMSMLFADMVLIIKNKKTSLDTIALSQKIALFEDVFQHVMTIAAKEPLAFVLFIASLHALREEIDDFYEA